jgi:hypothetical protein
MTNKILKPLYIPIRAQKPHFIRKHKYMKVFNIFLSCYYAAITITVRAAMTVRNGQLDKDIEIENVTCVNK